MKLQRLLPKAACLLIVLLLPAALMPGFTSTARANGYDIWTGTFSFTVTLYQPGPTGKIAKKSHAVSGTVELYLQSSPPHDPVAVPGSDGTFCMRFMCDQFGTILGIKDLTGVTSKIANAKSDTLIGVAQGTFFDHWGGSGPAYISVTKGTVTPAGDNPTTMTWSCQAGGGVDGDTGYYWTTKFSLTLHKGA